MNGKIPKVIKIIIFIILLSLIVFTIFKICFKAKNVNKDIETINTYINNEIYYNNDVRTNNTIIANNEIENNNTIIVNNEIETKNEIYSNENKKKYNGSLGSAGSLEGTTVIVSIYTNDDITSWNYENAEDINTIDNTLDNLKISTAWLSEQAKEYNATSKFIYDWNVNSDLKYITSFNQSLVRVDGSMYNTQKEYVKNNINTTSIKNKYNADNIIYMFFFNTDYSNDVNPWSLGYSSSETCDVEIINIFNKFKGQFIASPSGYAHELMHCFGAHDLYYPNEYINQEYIDHLVATNSNDIMHTVTTGKNIINDFTELDAYYVGLKNTSTEANKWNLGESEHCKAQ